jgi:beta-galactosidase
MLTVALLGDVTAMAAAPAPYVPQILYGASYYSEYMPVELGPERLHTDVALMKRAGITVVRMGESSWARLNLRTAASISAGWIAWSQLSARPASR